ncbi:MAG: hypothetical protein ACRDIF_00930 [Actinomycetota bacterium]
MDRFFAPSRSLGQSIKDLASSAIGGLGVGLFEYGRAPSLSAVGDKVAGLQPEGSQTPCRSSECEALALSRLAKSVVGSIKPPSLARPPSGESAMASVSGVGAALEALWKRFQCWRDLRHDYGPHLPHVGPIRAYSYHAAVEQIPSRGIKDYEIIDAATKPVKIELRPDGTTRYTGEWMWFAVNDCGKVTTAVRFKPPDAP